MVPLIRPRKYNKGLYIILYNHERIRTYVEVLVFRLTVAAGTINGLISYAFVVTMNSATFFKPKATNVLTVFIACMAKLGPRN